MVRPERHLGNFADDVRSVLSQFTCETAEEISAIEIISSPDTEAAQLFFCVGTYVYVHEEIEPSSGRLLVLGTLESRTAHSRVMELSLLTWTEVEGYVSSLTTMKGFLAAAVKASVSADLSTRSAI
jgi:hypothetical protein